MKPPRLLKNNIPAKVLAFRDEIMRRTNDNKLAETVNQRDIQATGAIDSLRAGQTVLITAEHANALANLPAPQASAPWGPTTRQSRPSLSAICQPSPRRQYHRGYSTSSKARQWQLKKPSSRGQSTATGGSK
jgi:hypothetical protein